MTEEWRADDEPPNEEDLGPGDADYDLSEAHPYTWEPRREHWPVPPWALVIVSIIAIASLLLPTIIFIATR